ncbi:MULTISPECIES: ABC transporter ATP-binding protein [unclassified Pseudodesulfovibrio]|uniref:ABC transporter ATP-binding protein n=1 Tax=unclassified Pseudodesulfovibrio TaxID=2661612 RepID=UPI001F4F916A|nr:MULTISPECIES: ABC transporter ATP-binding protein [unclassified Pseudodesulfovibrio]MCJ2163222.1 ABC transporter ATP-binding protein/permease [Pseudodesulfovibrio sp. S3-i]
MANNVKLFKFSSWYLLKRSIGYFGPYKSRILFAILAMLLYAPIGPALAWLTKYVTDQVLIDKDAATLKLCILAFVILIVSKCITQIGQVVIMNATGLEVLRDLRRDMFSKIIRLPMAYFADSEIGMLMNRVGGDVTSVRACLPNVIMFVRQIFTLAGLIGTTIFLDAYLAFWSLLVMPIAIYPFIYFGQKIRKYGRRTQANLSGLNVLLEENFSGIKVIKGFANEQRTESAFAHENENLTRLLIRSLLYNEGSSRIMDIIAAAAGATVLWVGGMRVVEGVMTPGDLTAFLVCLIQLYDPIKKMNSANQSIQTGLAGTERVFDMLDSPDIQAETDGDFEFDGQLRELTYENVDFAYPRTNHPSLSNINLNIKAGQRVAIVGPSGAGKTTLVNLLPRFYDLDKGRILLNGRPIQQYTLKSLRQGIGLVSQDTFLFNVSVSENIAYAHDDYDMDAVVRAAKGAYAHEFVSAMPEGYDTVVGEGGVKISGGQKQRLTIARAIMKDPSLLILDEATSALDTESERVVQMALDNLMEGRTSIVIAHRLSTILNADVILVMENGRIVTSGTHAELIESCPLYANLYKMQFEDNQKNAE